MRKIRYMLHRFFSFLILNHALDPSRPMMLNRNPRTSQLSIASVHGNETAVATKTIHGPMRLTNLTELPAKLQ